MKTFRTVLFLLLAGIAQAQSLSEVRAFLIKYEGYREAVYLDAGGYRTVGIGHNLTAHRQAGSVGTVLTRERIEVYFRDDLHRATASLRKNLKNYDLLPKDVKLVLISLVWTVGPEGFTKFKVLRNMIDRRSYHLAAAALQDSLWWKQVGPRRAREHYLMLKNAR